MKPFWLTVPVVLITSMINSDAKADDLESRIQNMIRQEIGSMRNEMMGEFITRLNAIENRLDRIEGAQSSRGLSHLVTHRRASSDRSIGSGALTQLSNTLIATADHSRAGAHHPARHLSGHHHHAGHRHHCSTCCQTPCTCHPRCGCPHPCGCAQRCCCLAKVTREGLSATKCGDCVTLCVTGCLPAHVSLQPLHQRGHYALTWSVNCCDVKKRTFKFQSSNGFFCKHCRPYICVHVCGVQIPIPVN